MTPSFLSIRILALVVVVLVVGLSSIHTASGSPSDVGLSRATPDHKSGGQHRRLRTISSSHSRLLKEPKPEIAADAPVVERQTTKEPLVGVAEEAPLTNTTKEPLVGVAEEAPLTNTTKEPLVGVASEAPVVDACVDDPNWSFRGKAKKNCEWIASRKPRATRIYCLRRGNRSKDDPTRVFEICRAACHEAGIKQACPTAEYE